MDEAKNNRAVLLKIIGAVLTLGVGILGYLLKEQMDFRKAWEQDEAIEESQQFDNPEQKVITINHVKKLDTDEVKVYMATQQQVNEKILEELEHLEKGQREQDSLNKRLNDQYYQLNQKIHN